MTTSGEIAFERAVWQCGGCRRSHAPVDRALGARPKKNWTSGVERKVACAAAMSPFEEASRLLWELGGLRVSSSQVDRTGQEHGAAVDRRQRAEEERWRQPVGPWREEAPEPKFSGEQLVIQADATTVLTRSGEEHKSVYCATAFTLDARGHSGRRPIITERLYTASAEDMEDFGLRLKALAWRAGMRGARVAFIGDGARCLWKWAEENLPGPVVFIQDFWHVCEHLAELAQTLFGERWKKPFERWKDWLRASHMERLLRSLRALRAQRQGEQRRAIEEKLHYLQTGRHRMDYARAEREGWPIGSGAIEGTCKHLVKSRFCVTGARWRRKQIPQILALRLEIFNNDWDHYWQAYRQSETPWENQQAA